ncbi:PcfK-like family protein [Limibacterium fermenti]|uniref:PcfK-like family protein n=1 Tax=Limibacterium fermenti TaxID=3229863 RepID=UPI003A77D981
MKATNHFKDTIKAYLDQRAESDILFSFRYSLPEKTIDNCIAYILDTVQKSGCNGFADEEIYSMAADYYLKDNIEIGKPINAHVVVNYVVELTAEEKEQARKDAIQRVQDEAYKKMTQPVKKAKKVALNPQPNLFDF